MKSLLEKNKDIISNMLHEKAIFHRNELNAVIFELKHKRLISQSISYHSTYEFFLQLGLFVHVVELNGKFVERYSMKKNIDIYQLANSIKANSFFSMSTALNLQKYTNFMDEFVFVSSEQSAKTSYEKYELSQESIDRAYRKEYRVTKKYGLFQDVHIVQLYPKNNNKFEVIDFNGFKISSINRAFVEMVVNVQYFRSSRVILQIFSDLTLELDVNRIFKAIESFNFIYPYYQLFGHLLERLGFIRASLKQFEQKISDLKFYTDKNQQDYLYDEYWKVYYIK